MICVPNAGVLPNHRPVADRDVRHRDHVYTSTEQYVVSDLYRAVIPRFEVDLPVQRHMIPERDVAGAMNIYSPEDSDTWIKPTGTSGLKMGEGI
jgi:hypothetical protein